jgi:ABC-type nitrate/sulfonate/bicarbonate transport system substrate-binding protein
LERLELEKKGFPILFDIGSVMPGFPFVVIVAGKQKIESDPDSVVALLRAINRGLDFLKKNPEKVADAMIKKNTFGDPATVRKVQLAGELRRRGPVLRSRLPNVM